MRIAVLAVGKPKGPLATAIAEYEHRAGRYFNFSAVEVREETSRGAADAARVMDEEAKRLLVRAREGSALIALDRDGDAWSSGRFARHLAELALGGGVGATFLVGGAFGLGDAIQRRATHRVSLSACTLPHDLARLVLTEQLYRAGTINRGEPYHQGPAA